MLKITNLNIEEIRIYANNPRKNNNAVKYVAESIKKFGMKQPLVVDKNKVIVCGHTRYKACLELGIKQVPCVLADDLTEDEINAYRLADNKTAEYSEWDETLLEFEIDNILNIDMSDFGFLIDTDKLDPKNIKEKDIKKMELRPFEHHDYIVFLFNNQHDFLNLVSFFGLEKIDAGFTTKKIGLGRVIDGKKLLEKIKCENIDIESL